MGYVVPPLLTVLCRASTTVCPAPTPSRFLPKRWVRGYRGGPLQFLCQTVGTYHSPYAGGFLVDALPSSSPLPWPSLTLPHTRKRVPGSPLPLSGNITARQDSHRAMMLRSVPLLDPLSGPLSLGFTGRISPDDANQLRGGLAPTSARLSLASLTWLSWTHAVTR
jgi:hypothetical protein